jgi:hypothetical protein
MRFFPKVRVGARGRSARPGPLTLLPQLPDLLLDALAPIPAPLGTDKPVGPAGESFAADNAVPLRRRMLGAVALSPLSVVGELIVTVPSPPISRRFTRTLTTARSTAQIPTPIGRESFQGEPARTTAARLLRWHPSSEMFGGVSHLSRTSPSRERVTPENPGGGSGEALLKKAGWSCQCLPGEPRSRFRDRLRSLLVLL